MNWGSVLLLVMAPAPMVRVEPMNDFNWKMPAVLLNLRELMLQFAFMSGNRRAVPAKMRSAVALFAGTVFVVQFRVLVHWLPPESPPFHVQVAAKAGATASKTSRCVSTIVYCPLSQGGPRRRAQ